MNFKNLLTALIVFILAAAVWALAQDQWDKATYLVVLATFFNVTLAVEVLRK